MLDFTGVKAITIPEGKVKKITRKSDGVVLWEKASKPSFTNVLPLAQQYSSTAPYIGADGSVGYGNNMRISTSSPSTTYMKALNGVDTTAMIPVKRGDVLRFKNCNFKVTPSNTSYGTHLYGFDSDKAIMQTFNGLYHSIPNRFHYVVKNDEYVELTLEPTEAWLAVSSAVSDAFDKLAYIMIGTDGLDETSIITVNEEITSAYKNIIDEVGTIDNVRLRSGGGTASASGFASNYFSVKAGDVIRVYFPNGNRGSIPSNGVYACLYSSKNDSALFAYDGSTSSSILKNVTDKGYEIHLPTDVAFSYARVAGGPAGAYEGWIVTVNEEIK